MSVYGQAITKLSEGESWKLLAGVELGRLITSVQGQPELFPVVFEADHHNMTEGWSVIVKSRAHVLETPREISGRRFRFGPEPDRESAFA